jgi:hypothetical protein
MKKIALIVSIAFAVPSLALAAKPPAPGSSAAHQYKKPAGHAYGFYCQNQSKVHVAGTPGTPFSTCVTAMAKLAAGTAPTPKAACATESKKHVAGKPGTPFSLCVSAGAQLQKDRHS